MIPFGQFAPSQASHYPGTIDLAEGVFPLGAQDWRSFPVLNIYSDALPAAPLGAIQVQTPSGDQHTYAGTQTALHRLNTATSPYSWTDVTGALSFTAITEDPIDFVAFGDKVLAFNKGLGGVAIADIGTGDFTLISGAPTSGFGGVFGDRVWALNQVSTPNRVEFSAPNDHTVWGDYSRGADFQVLETGGPVTGAKSVGNLFYVFQEDGVQVFVRDPGPNLFQRQEVRQNFGAPSKQSIVSGPDGAFFISEDGFYLASGGGVAGIGTGVVDEWFFETQADLDKLWAIQGAHDPANKFILWRYGTPGFAGSGYTNKVIGYCYGLQRWFGFSLDCSWLLRAASPGLLADGISDLADSTTISVDSRTWSGGRPQLAGFDSSFRFGFFDGSSMACTIETADLQLSSMRRTRINGFRPIIEGTSNYSGQVGTKATPTGAVTWKAAGTANRAGVITQRGEGLYLKARVNVPAGEAWSALSAVELMGQQKAGMT